MVAKSFHVRLAAGRRIALGIWRTHVGRIFADNIGECSLVLDHLLLSHVGRDILKAVVGPRVGSDLMSFIDHARDDRWVRSGSVNGTLAQVVASNKECGMEAKALQGV